MSDPADSDHEWDMLLQTQELAEREEEEDYDDE